MQTLLATTLDNYINSLPKESNLKTKNVINDHSKKLHASLHTCISFGI